MTGMAEKASSAAMGWRDRVRAFLYGMMNYEFERHTVEMRANLDTLFMALTFGDMLGLPIIPPFYTLRILPYIVPNINTWKRRTHELNTRQSYGHRLPDYRPHLRRPFYLRRN